MKIDQDAKDFLSKNKNLINKSDFTALYNSACSRFHSDYLIPQMTYIFYSAGIDPLQYMNFVPQLFAYELKLPNPIIDIPERIEDMHPYAFTGTNIVKIIIPANLKDISEGAFSRCNDLIEADFSKCHLSKKINEYLFADCPNLKIVKFPKNLRIIKSGVFVRCTSLTSIDLSNCHKLTTIKDNAFGGCDNLTTIYLPNSIERIGKRAFNTGKSITIIFDGTQQEWENKFGTERDWRV